MSSLIGIDFSGVSFTPENLDDQRIDYKILKHTFRKDIDTLLWIYDNSSLEMQKE